VVSTICTGGFFGEIALTQVRKALGLPLARPLSHAAFGWR
jgi:hypothetical protein